MDTSQVIKAHEVAKKAHFGQIDRAGIDYIKHPETVIVLSQLMKRKLPPIYMM